MLDQLRRTLHRRERLVRIRQLQQDQAQLALTALLREEEALRQQRRALENAHADVHGSLLARFDDAASVRGDELQMFAQQMERLSQLIRSKEREMEALQPSIRQRREEVVNRYKARRSMEILTDKTRERVEHEELRQEQASLDDITSQRFQKPRQIP